MAWNSPIREIAAAESRRPARALSAFGGFALIAMLAFGFSCGPATADQSAIMALMEKLDKSEQELVAEELRNRIPSMLLSDEDKAFAEKLASDAQKMRELAEQIAQSNYQGLGEAMAQATAEELRAQIEKRYDEDSMVRRVMESVEGNAELYKTLGQAALNANPDAARVAFQDALKEFADKKVGELRSQGEEFWKDMVRGVIPASDTLSKIGLDPVDIYLQGVQDWADLNKRARRNLNTYVFDCLRRRYVLVRQQYPRGDMARETVESLGLSGFNCVEARRREEPNIGTPSWLRRVIDFFQGRATDTGTLADIKLERSEIVDLIEEFERLSDAKKASGSGTGYASA